MEKEVSGISRRFAFSELRPEILRQTRILMARLRLRYEVATINDCHIPY